ncbi:UDP-2,3-diacylglucosamine diphosphatase [Rickettsiella endosymbiont of Litargus connexus]|jgi:UDP-2,3-diacylglucosamine hydrolase|uniref:UDP-2,3-diacylglucosamine diphosphatase n=1 Tax=Rickettsiella endosymbiont of Litargus connexus TaxID=3066237 RepID=UPI00376EC73E
MSTLFISDLHLSSDQPAITQLFLNFLQYQAKQAEALYILGDLFEIWVGDDNLSTYNQSIIAALAELTASGIATYFMPGNRDFLIGKRFIQQTGCRYLTDPTMIDLYGNPTLLTHGDSWCTLDKHYQRYRRWSRNPFWQFLFLHLPLVWRQKIANFLRNQEHSTASTDATKYDVTLPDMLACLKHYSGTQQIIHGHTHLPSIQLIKIADDTWIKRFVLSDWTSKQGNVLSALPNHSFELIYFN